MATSSTEFPSDRVLRGLSKLKEARALSIRGSFSGPSLRRTSSSEPDSPEGPQSPRSTFGNNIVQFENPLKQLGRHRQSSKSESAVTPQSASDQEQPPSPEHSPPSSVTDGEEGGLDGEPEHKLSVALMEEQLGELQDQHQALLHLLKQGPKKKAHEIKRFSNHVSRLNRELDGLQYMNRVAYPQTDGQTAYCCGLESVINAGSDVVSEEMYTSCLKLGKECDDLRAALVELGDSLARQREALDIKAKPKVEAIEESKGDEEEASSSEDAAASQDEPETVEEEPDTVEKTAEELEEEAQWHARRFRGKPPKLRLWRAGQHDLSVPFSLQPSTHPHTVLVPNTGARLKDSAIRYARPSAAASATAAGRDDPDPVKGERKAIALLDMIEIQLPRAPPPAPRPRALRRLLLPGAEMEDEQKDPERAYLGECHLDCEEHLEAVRGRLLHIEHRLRDLGIQQQAEAEERLRDSARHDTPDLPDPFAGHFHVTC